MRFDWSTKEFIYSALKHKNDVSGIIGCLLVVRVCHFTKELELYIHARYIVFLFVKTENDNFIKEIKMFSVSP